MMTNKYKHLEDIAKKTFKYNLNSKITDYNDRQNHGNVHNGFII